MDLKQFELQEFEIKYDVTSTNIYTMNFNNINLQNSTHDGTDFLISEEEDKSNITYFIEDDYGNILLNDVQNFDYIITYITDVLIANDEFKEVDETTFNELKSNFEDYGTSLIEGSYTDILMNLTDFYVNDIRFQYINKLAKYKNKYLFIGELN